MYSEYSFPCRQNRSRQRPRRTPRHPPSTEVEGVIALRNSSRSIVRPSRPWRRTVLHLGEQLASVLGHLASGAPRRPSLVISGASLPPPPEEAPVATLAALLASSAVADCPSPSSRRRLLPLLALPFASSSALGLRPTFLGLLCLLGLGNSECLASSAALPPPPPWPLPPPRP